VVADRARHDDRVAGPRVRHPEIDVLIDEPDTGRVDVAAVGLPFCTTFVSPVTICTPAASAAARIDAVIVVRSSTRSLPRG
jgi:hypothetical protein